MYDMLIICLEVARRAGEIETVNASSELGIHIVYRDKEGNRHSLSNYITDKKASEDAPVEKENEDVPVL